MITERSKYFIILIDKIQSGEVRKISFKFPIDLKHCKGVIFSGNIAGKANNNYVLGNVSLLFNNRKSHPLHYTIHSKPLPGKKWKLLKLAEAVEGSSFVQGYYVDSGIATSYPYTIRIYLNCITTNG